ncbi:MAG: hypothetical protein PUH81_04325 [Clostridiales bacterium]|nr:hypothetical protein [Clostridiales bacterium]MDY5468198.1 hypothetical protein [Eubacteriales bacterium]
MSNITIIEAKRTIEITKAFAQKSAKYGSPEYLELREARHDFPKSLTPFPSSKAKIEFSRNHPPIPRQRNSLGQNSKNSYQDFASITEGSRKNPPLNKISTADIAMRKGWLYDY